MDVRRIAAIIGAAALLFVLPSCSDSPERNSPATYCETSELQEPPETESLPGIKYRETSVKVEYRTPLEELGIDEGAAETIAEYFRIYYQSLGSCEAGDISSLYSFDTDYERRLAETMIDYQILIRRNMDIDLSFGECSVGLTFLEYLPSERTAEVKLYVNHSEKYAFAGDIASYTSGVEHVFRLERAQTGWYIISHSEISGVYSLISEKFDLICKEKRLTLSTMTANQLSSVFSALNEQLVKENDEGLSLLYEQKSEYNSSKKSFEPKKTADNPYDANSAVEYSYEWAGKTDMKRNPAYPEYDNYGGNCNNFTSQCICAGGIPMDYRGDIYNQWKYYGPVVSGYNRAYGRSTSWAGVEEFYNYCSTNDGFGMVTEITDNVYCARPGDIVQYVDGGRGVHSAIVSRVVYDDNGDVAELLINSNTTDKVDSPMSIYGYTRFRLIRIIGWNN